MLHTSPYGTKALVDGVYLIITQQIKQGQELRIGEDYVQKSGNPLITRKLQLTTNTGKLPAEKHAPKISEWSRKL
jgi:hypothetical protein